MWVINTYIVSNYISVNYTVQPLYSIILKKALYPMLIDRFTGWIKNDLNDFDHSCTFMYIPHFLRNMTTTLTTLTTEPVITYYTSN